MTKTFMLYTSVSPLGLPQTLKGEMCDTGKEM